MNETHMLSQKSNQNSKKSKKSRGYNSPQGASNVSASQKMQPGYLAGSPKNVQALTQNIQIGQVNQSRQQAHQFQQSALQTSTASRLPSHNLLTNIERIIQNNIVQSDLDRQLIAEVSMLKKDRTSASRSPNRNAKTPPKKPASTNQTKRDSVSQSLQLNLQALQAPNANKVSATKDESAGASANTQATAVLPQQQIAMQKP